MASSKLSISEMRAVCQPVSIMGRPSAEHWAGRLYMRHLSIYLTRAMVPTRITPDAVTWLMILSGVAASAVLAVPGVVTPILALVLIQLQLLFDCSDGELARWRKQTGPIGVYLDRIGHYVTEAGLIMALGVRADGGYTSIGGWTTWGLLGAVFILMNKAETDLVNVARSAAGMPALEEKVETLRPRASGLALARRAATYLPLHRAIGAPELTLLAVVAGVVDAASAGPAGTRALVLVLVPLAASVAGGHLLSILSSSRFK